MTVNKTQKIASNYDFSKFLSSTSYSKDNISKILSNANDIILNAYNNYDVSAKEFIIAYNNLRLLIGYDYKYYTITLKNHIVKGSLNSYPTINLKNTLQELFVDDSTMDFNGYHVKEKDDHGQKRVDQRSLTTYASEYDIRMMCQQLILKMIEIEKLGITFKYGYCHSHKTKQTICFQLSGKTIIILTYLDVNHNIPKDGNLLFYIR